jgi:hypothetical protein
MQRPDWIASLSDDEVREVLWHAREMLRHGASEDGARQAEDQFRGHLREVVLADRRVTAKFKADPRRHARLIAQRIVADSLDHGAEALRELWRRALDRWRKAADPYPGDEAAVTLAAQIERGLAERWEVLGVEDPEIPWKLPRGERLPRYRAREERRRGLSPMERLGDALARAEAEPVERPEQERIALRLNLSTLDGAFLALIAGDEDAAAEAARALARRSGPDKVISARFGHTGARRRISALSKAKGREAAWRYVLEDVLPPAIYQAGRELRRSILRPIRLAEEWVVGGDGRKVRVDPFTLSDADVVRVIGASAKRFAEEAVLGDPSLESNSSRSRFGGRDVDAGTLDGAEALDGVAVGGAALRRLACAEVQLEPVRKVALRRADKLCGPVRAAILRGVDVTVLCSTHEMRVIQGALRGEGIAATAERLGRSNGSIRVTRSRILAKLSGV